MKEGRHSLEPHFLVEDVISSRDQRVVFESWENVSLMRICWPLTREQLKT